MNLRTAIFSRRLRSQRIGRGSNMKSIKFKYQKQTFHGAFLGVAVLILPLLYPHLFGPLGRAMPSLFSEWKAPIARHAALVEAVSKFRLREREHLDLWSPLPNQGWQPCAESLVLSRLASSGKTQAYLQVFLEGGLNQQRMGICDAVAVAKILNATLVVPHFDVNPVWQDSSSFADIFDVDHFIHILKDDVAIVKDLPREYLWSTREYYATGIRATRVKTAPVRAPASWYLENVLPILQSYGIVAVAPFSHRLAFDNIPMEIQRLRCKVNFHALVFVPHIRALGDALVTRLRSPFRRIQEFAQENLQRKEIGQLYEGSGKFVVLHLRFDKDMAAHSACNFEGGKAEQLALAKYRQVLWQGRVMNSQFSDEELRNQGRCPLTPEEIGLLLAALGFGNRTRLYLASHKVYGGEARISILRQLFPLMEDKKSLATVEELEELQGKASVSAAVDYYVSMQSDIFISASPGNMHNALALFPDNTYGVDSGGDPRVIPKLTFKEFQEFHGKFYHPSNARIWFYGDDDPNERLRIISAYLDQFEASSAAKESEVKPQKLFSEPKRVVEKYPVGDAGDLKKRHIVCLNWVLSEEPLHLETELALGFLDHLLLGTPAAPLRKILLESGLGDAIVGGGIEDELLQPQFSIGLKNVSEHDVKAVEELIMSTLKKLADEGFSSEAVEASMNTIEFQLRENNTGSFPRGLSLMLRSIGKWLYGKDPFEPLKFEKPLEALKARIAQEGSKAIFSPLIQKFILDNPHRVTVELQPDPDKASQDDAAEQEDLKKLKANMTEEDLAELVRATKELRLKQETSDPPEALKTVPSLSLHDIPKEPIYIPIDVGDIGGVKILRHDLFTNEVLYADVLFDMRPLKPTLLPLVPLFCQSLLEMGTKDMDFVKLNQLIGRKTGGISVYPSISSVRGKEEPSSHLIARGKAMSGQVNDLFKLIRTVLQDVQFTDQQRFKQFVSQGKVKMESRLTGSGHGIAAARMDAKLNIAGWVGEKMGGLSYLEFLQNLEKQVEEDWSTVASSLEDIRSILLSRKGALINLTADEKNLVSAEKHVTELLNTLPESSVLEIPSWDNRLPPVNEALVIPTQVNYVGKAANIYETGYQLNGSAYVISKYIGNTWLWDRVRVSGGAYGGFCDFDSHSGVFSYLSYRDPNLLKTLDVYDGTAQFLQELDLDGDTLSKAIIGTIGDVDSYQLPDAKGYSSLMRYLLGVTEEERRKRREEILSTSPKDFHEFADVLGAVKDKGVVVAVASADDVISANQQRPGFLKVKKVL